MTVTNRRRRTAAALGAVLLGLVTFTTPTLAHATGDDGDDDGIRRGGRRHDVPEDFGSVDNGSAMADASPTPSLDADLRAVTATAGSSVVEISGDDAAVAAAVAQAGGTLGRGGGGLYLATVPNASLSAVASAAGVRAVSEPVTFESSASEASAAGGDVSTQMGPMTGQHTFRFNSWHQAGYLGGGAKVGIVALFDADVLATEIAQGELGNIPVGRRICISQGSQCPFGTPGATWGNSLAEIVADGAPQADLYLAELGTRPDYYAVIDWMASKGVTILLNPLIWTYDGPGNGTGPSAAIVDYAVAKGIMWVNTAGEMANSHWAGPWYDPDNDRLLNFVGSDESLSMFCGSLLGLRWTDWGKPLTDYDLLVSDYNLSTQSNGTRKVLSGNSQAVAGAQPLEGVTGANLCSPTYDTNQDGAVTLWVQRTTRTINSPVGDQIEIGVYWGLFEHQNYGWSAAIAFADSANEGMLTVSGLGSSNQWPDPSNGPTLDNRVKPELRSDICIATSVDGGFQDYQCANGGYWGSDAAAGVVAAMAAVAGPVVGTTTPQQLALYLRDQWVEGPSQPERTKPPWEASREAALPTVPPPAGAYPLSELAMNTAPQRLLDTRPPNPVGTARAVPLQAGETIHVFVGLYPAVLLNVGMVRPAAKGYLSVYPAGWAAPTANSAINVDAPGQVRSNSVIVPAANGWVNVYSSVATDLIVDRLAVFVPHDGGAGQLVTTTPTRILDTRTCLGLTGCDGTARPSSTWTTVEVGGFEDPADDAADVPEDAIAAVVSITVDSPINRGFLSAVPGGQGSFTSSNMNYEVGQSLTDMAIVPINAANPGEIDMFISGSTHLQVDLLGWFTGSGPVDSPAGAYQPVRPQRTLDTRQPLGSPKVAPATLLNVDATLAGVPADAAAVFMNNAAVATAGTGVLQVCAAEQAFPPVFQNLSSGAVGLNIAASTISRLAGGHYTMKATMTSHFISDVGGYFLGAAP